MNKKKGFSLVELLVVVAIIGILSVILVPNVRENIKRAKVASTKALIGSLEMAIVTYESDFNKYPASFNPQELYLALTEEARTVYEPDAEEIKKYESGQSFWVDDQNGDDRIHSILSSAGVPATNLVAQMEENVFVDSWGNPLYYVSYEVYNPGGRTDFRRAASNNRTVKLDAPVAYEMKEGDRYKPYKPTSFQIISFGPDETTITPDTRNGGIGSMLDSDNVDNDGDGYVDHLDQVRQGSISDNSPDVVAEDDVTNFN